MGRGPRGRPRRAEDGRAPLGARAAERRAAPRALLGMIFESDQIYKKSPLSAILWVSSTLPCTT